MLQSCSLDGVQRNPGLPLGKASPDSALRQAQDGALLHPGYRVVFQFCLLGLLWLALPAWADQPEPYLHTGTDYLHLSPRMSFLHDPDSQLSPQQALGAEGYRPLQKADLLQSFNAGAFWLQLSLYNPTPEPLAFWLELGTPRIHWVELHHQGQILLTGAKVPMAEKPVASARAVLPLELAPGANRLLLRVQSDSAVFLAAHLWRPEVFRSHEGRADLKTVLVIGGMLLASALSIIAFALLREWPYLFLGLTQLFAIPLEMARTGLMQAYLWPESWPFFSQVITLSGTLVLICLSLFVSSFLDLRQRQPRWNRLLLALLLPTLAAGLLSLWDYPSGVRLLSLLVLIQLPLNLLLTLIAWRSGHRSARYLALAFTLFWVLETLRQLANNGILSLPAAMHFSLLTTLLLASPRRIFSPGSAMSCAPRSTASSAMRACSSAARRGCRWRWGRRTSSTTASACWG
jgi:hypothetical protein